MSSERERIAIGDIRRLESCIPCVITTTPGFSFSLISSSVSYPRLHIFARDLLNFFLRNVMAQLQSREGAKGGSNTQTIARDCRLVMGLWLRCAASVVLICWMLDYQ